MALARLGLNTALKFVIKVSSPMMFNEMLVNRIHLFSVVCPSSGRLTLRRLSCVNMSHSGRYYSCEKRTRNSMRTIHMPINP